MPLASAAVRSWWNFRTKLPPHTQQALATRPRSTRSRGRQSQSDRSRNDQGFCSVSRDHLAQDSAWGGRDPGGGDLDRDRNHRALRPCRATRQLLRPGGARALQRREDSAYGAVRRDVNVYLKWAFVEAANSSMLNRRALRLRSYQPALPTDQSPREATARPRWLWRATFRRPVFGCLRKESPIGNRCRPRNAKRAELMGPSRPAF